MVMVSVIMPAYNSEKTIAESIQSVLMQSYYDLELLVIDDASNDATNNIVKVLSNKDGRIKLLHSKNNIGVAKARNIGINAAKGKYIAFLDSDDVWFLGKLESQINKCESEGHLVCISGYYRFSSTGDSRKEVIPPMHFVFEDLLNGNLVGNLTGIYNCHALGKYMQDSIPHEDYLMWLSILKSAKYGFGIQDVLAGYRVSEKSISSNKIKSAKWTWDIYRKYLSLSLYKSIKHFSLYIYFSLLKRL